MFDPKPGEGGVPYNHLELFLASPYRVGKGLDTFSGVDSENLREKESFKDVRDDFDTLATVRSNEKLWKELVESAVVKKLAESEFTVEYVAKHAPDIPEGTYNEVKDLIDYDELAHVDRETIEWVLSVHLTHLRIWSDRSLLNKLLQNEDQWMDYFVNLTTFGDPINSLDTETIIQLALHSVDAYGQDPYEVFSDPNAIDEFLSQGNFLSSGPKSDYSVTTSPDGFIKGRSNQRDIGFSTSPAWNTPNWRGSEYTNSTATGLLDRSAELRKIITQGRLGLNDPDFDYLHLFDGAVLDNFWDDDILDYEFIGEARATSNTDNANRNNHSASASGNINTESNLYMRANADADSSSRSNRRYAVSADETVRIATRNFDVSSKNSVQFTIAGGETRYDSDSDSFRRNRNMNTSVSSSVKIDIGNDSKEWEGGDDPETTTFDISNDDTMKIEFQVASDASARERNSSNRRLNVDAAARAILDVSDISFD